MLKCKRTAFKRFSHIRLVKTPGFRSVYLHHYLFAVSYGTCAHNGSDSLCDTTLFADDSSHIIRGNVQMINYSAVLAGFIDLISIADLSSTSSSTIAYKSSFIDRPPIS